MRRIVIFFLTVAFAAVTLQAQIDKEQRHSLKKFSHDDALNFLILNDAGKNGYGDQKKVAETMGDVADATDVKFIVSAGDQHHFHGVQSILDPLWTTNFEIIYTHPALLEIPWYAIAGNHEYRGNVDAFMNYGQRSSRWKMPARYYTFEEKTKNGASLRVIMLDTSPMIEKYRNPGSEAASQDWKQQIAWLDAVLKNNRSDWTVVIGHHPIYANTSKLPEELENMQQRLNPVLLNYPVDFYICGHIHNFQHITKTGCSIDYVVNTSASSSRSVYSTNGLLFSLNNSGFIHCCMTKKALRLNFMDSDGSIVYHIEKHK